MRRFLAAAGLVFIGVSAHAASRMEYLDQTIWQVTRAYARHSFELSPNLEKKLSAVSDDLFPTFGMRPNSGGGITWELTRVSDDRSLLCVKQIVDTVSEWNSGILRFAKNGLSPATPSTCATTNSQGTAPPAFPATLAGVLELDRRDTPSRTVVPNYPVLQGIDATAVTRPALTVSALQGPSTITVFNPFIEISPGVGAVVGVTSITTRPEFSIEHNCSEVAAGSSCSISVAYDGSRPAGMAGQLIVQFSTGETANVGLLGTR
jgi:hypothetical protein